MNIGRRIEVVGGFGEVIARIKMPRGDSLAPGLLISLTYLTAVGIEFIQAVIAGGRVTGTSVVWLCNWFVLQTILGGALLWNVFGLEVISVSKDFFTHEREMFGHRMTKKSIPANELSDLRAAGSSAPKLSFKFSSIAEQWGFTGGAITVDRQGETYSFGLGLNEKEANALADELKSYLRP